MAKNSWLSVISVVALSACVSARQDVVEPNAVTLEQAMRDVVDSLSVAKAESDAKGGPYGFYGCTVTVVFNINATGTKDNKLTLGVSGGPPASVAPVTVNLTGSSEATATGTRGNTITMVFGSEDCLPQASAAAGGASAVKGASRPSTPRKRQPSFAPEPPPAPR
jgi:hypothetical protein